MFGVAGLWSSGSLLAAKYRYIIECFELKSIEQRSAQISKTKILEEPSTIGHFYFGRFFFNSRICRDYDKNEICLCKSQKSRREFDNRIENFVVRKAQYLSMDIREIEW